MTEHKKRRDIKIPYCMECGYDSLAKRLAAQVAERFDLTTTLDVGHGGIYAIS